MSERAGWLDGDGYPTDAALERLTNWRLNITEETPEVTWRAWFAFARELWRWPDWGWTQVDREDGRTGYWISTGGWSGNESVIDAMQGNLAFWAFTWLEARAGGHYRFEVRPLRRDPPVREVDTRREGTVKGPSITDSLNAIITILRDAHCTLTQTTETSMTRLYQHGDTRYLISTAREHGTIAVIMQQLGNGRETGVN